MHFMLFFGPPQSALADPGPPQSALDRPVRPGPPIRAFRKSIKNHTNRECVHYGVLK